MFKHKTHKKERNQMSVDLKAVRKDILSTYDGFSDKSFMRQLTSLNFLFSLASSKAFFLSSPKSFVYVFTSSINNFISKHFFSIKSIVFNSILEHEKNPLNNRIFNYRVNRKTISEIHLKYSIKQNAEQINKQIDLYTRI